MSHRFYSDPVTRCARRKSGLRLILGWAWEQLVWLACMLVLVAFLWVVYWALGWFLGQSMAPPPWEALEVWFTMAEGRGAPLTMVDGGLLPLPLAVVALPKGGGVILLVVLGLAGLVALAVRKTWENDRRGLGGRVRPTNISSPPPPLPTRTRPIGEWMQECEALMTAGLPAKIKVFKEVFAPAPVDPLGETLPVGLNAAELERILCACLTEAAEVRLCVRGAGVSMNEDDCMDALRKADAAQAQVITCIQGLLRSVRASLKPEVRIELVDHLSPALREMSERVAAVVRGRPEYRGQCRPGGARPDTLKREQRTTEVVRA